MADHVRTQLRDAIVEAVTGLTTTGTRVIKSRIQPAKIAGPTLLVYATSETADGATIDDPSIIERRITVRIEGLAKATADLDDTLDLIAKEVEIALAAALDVGGVETSLSYTGTEIEFSDEIEQGAGVVTLTFEAVLYTAASQPDVIVGA